jgi:glycosyltransferase involved in cell wall biosynthesis
MKILFLVPYPLKSSPSQRFRFEQYFDTLQKAGHQFKVQSFLTSWGWRTIYQSGRGLQKVVAIAYGFIRRLFIMPPVITADFVFVHREVTPVGPPLFEWMIAKVFRKRIIYDFDDAIWTTDNLREGRIEKQLRWRSKVAYTCRVAYKVSCGNDFLCEYARQFNSNVVLNPTTIDTDYHLPIEKQKQSRITIGWTGSHTTLKYLDTIVPVIKNLESRFTNLKFTVIANEMPAVDLKSLEFVRWNETTEIEDLSKLDIGIMPLPDDNWSKGKCGFKALQYMALEIPAVVSPVGVNVKIVSNAVDGFVASTANEWSSILEKLITDEGVRARIGKAGRKKVVENYSVLSNAPNFLELFS